MAQRLPAYYMCPKEVHDELKVFKQEMRKNIDFVWNQTKPRQISAEGKKHGASTVTEHGTFWIPTERLQTYLDAVTEEQYNKGWSDALETFKRWLG